MSSSIAKLNTSFIAILILLTSPLSSSSLPNGTLQIIDLWYDWPSGRNFNIVQDQLGSILYDLEWNNGTSFFYSLDSSKSCSSVQLEVGILRPNWFDGAEYMGQRHVDGLLCNVWTKVDFLQYYEEVVTKRPVLWVFYTGREAHAMTFEVGAVLEDAKWQAPVYCFDKKAESDNKGAGFSITGSIYGRIDKKSFHGDLIFFLVIFIFYSCDPMVL
ncbi:hypothetical protein RchiOBHm_Chr4g0428721 [Rosa chinensis]|uniref:Uncharacterized protein n=1 Tax=Rosa chinensis TaxID=74649 RepID=A0A2P6QZZ3_ROSCH|nr:uncharacterized protein At4g14100 [Rosa chinensis]PRQ39757.1 hypothetical protein RchiOBHm_Chr4g0428721 [Rosa chinensis]